RCALISAFMARSITAFFKDRKSDSNSLWVIGWVTSCSTSSLGIFGSKAHCVRECVFDFFFLGISTPISHDMPRTQNFGQVRLRSACESCASCLDVFAPERRDSYRWSETKLLSSEAF